MKQIALPDFKGRRPCRLRWQQRHRRRDPSPSAPPATTRRLPAPGAMTSKEKHWKRLEICSKDLKTFLIRFDVITFPMRCHSFHWFQITSERLSTFAGADVTAASDDVLSEVSEAHGLQAQRQRPARLHGTAPGHHSGLKTLLKALKYD